MGVGHLGALAQAAGAPQPQGEQDRAPQRAWVSKGNARSGGERDPKGDTRSSRWARPPPLLEKKACVPQEPLRGSNRGDTFPDLV